MKLVMLGGNTKEEIERRIQVVAAAGCLSRYDGTVTQVFESCNDYESNLKLARAIVGYGHKSIAEHDYVVFALEDVTPIVEQTIIGYRLTSFTIKSRRNVDFRNVGFYVPDFKDKEGKVLSNNEELKDTYTKYMQSLFDKYGDLVEESLPVEDCRYILPYSYHSNIIMGCDANEFLRITCDLLYGKLSNITELRMLGEQFANIINEYIPFLSRALAKEKENEYYKDQYEFLDQMVKRVPEKSEDASAIRTISDKEIEIFNEVLLPEVNMTNYTPNADEIVLCNIIKSRYQLSYEDASVVLTELCKTNPGLKEKLMTALIHSKNQRELEQVIFSFEIPISLAVLTHITRHRMHSLLVPDFVPLWNLDNYVMPDTIKDTHEDEFKEIFAANKLMVEHFKKAGVRDEDLVYFYLSGTACNISTTMNARCLSWIAKMRCCNKAQWEIRNIANKMVAEASEVAPLIGTGLGATCKVFGYCPEGKDSCKNRGVVKFGKNFNK